MSSPTNDQPVAIPVTLRHNLGTRAVRAVKSVGFPDAGVAVSSIGRKRPATAVDVLLVNPPSPDGGIWIRTQHRVGRRSREEMVWPQCSLAQLAAMLQPDYSVAVIDAIAERMSWTEFEAQVRQKAPKYYITQATAPTLTNDMYGVMLAKSIGARTIAFGTHVTPMPFDTMRDYPALDFILRGEPELSFRELVDILEGREANRPDWVVQLFKDCDPVWQSQNGDGAAAANRTCRRSRGWSGETAASIARTRTGPSFRISTRCLCRCTTCCPFSRTACR